jgi:hypothetical protein
MPGAAANTTIGFSMIGDAVRQCGALIAEQGSVMTLHHG